MPPPHLLPQSAAATSISRRRPIHTCPSTLLHRSLSLPVYKPVAGWLLLLCCCCRLLTEVKKLDDKLLLVDIHLLESRGEALGLGRWQQGRGANLCKMLVVRGGVMHLGQVLVSSRRHILTHVLHLRCCCYCCC